MPGPPPKPPSQRRRRNTTSTAKTLVPLDAAAIADLKPQLAERSDGQEWHPVIPEYWDAIWRSPMAPELLEVDLFEFVFIYLTFVDDFLKIDVRTTDGLRDKLYLSKEIRLQSQRYGFAPLDRWRLKWAIESTENATDKRARRKSSATGSDPRAEYPIQP